MREEFFNKAHESNNYSLHTINITRTPRIFDTPLMGKIYIDNWIDKKIFYKN